MATVAKAPASAPDEGLSKPGPIIGMIAKRRRKMKRDLLGECGFGIVCFLSTRLRIILVHRGRSGVANAVFRRVRLGGTAFNVFVGCRWAAWNAWHDVLAIL